MTLQEILALKTVANDHAIHYMNEGQIVASIFKNVPRLGFNAHLGDDEDVVMFSFEHSGPVAILYDSPIAIGELLPLTVHGCVIAIMSMVTFGDISLFSEMNPMIFPTAVGQYDIGDPEKFDLARQLICNHTGGAWDEEFFPKMHREYCEQVSTMFNRQEGSSHYFA